MRDPQVLLELLGGVHDAAALRAKEQADFPSTAGRHPRIPGVPAPVAPAAPVEYEVGYPVPFLGQHAGALPLTPRAVVDPAAAHDLADRVRLRPFRLF